MDLHLIIQSLNSYFKSKFPDAKGWLIGREFIEPTQVNVYKKYTIEIYYHLPRKNNIVFTVSKVDRCVDNDYTLLKKNTIIELLTLIFKDIKELDKYGIE